jgi:hypothetical protein
MSKLLARWTQQTNDAETARAVLHAIRESVVIEIEPGSPAGKKALRGIPVVGGCSGTQPGTDPLHALLEKERRQG